MTESFVFKTLSVRVKDCHSKVLSVMAFEVNQTFNYANEITSSSYKNSSEYGPKIPEWLSNYDVEKYTAGIQTKNNWLIGSSTIQSVVAEHAKARKIAKISKLRWRVSSGKRKSLGWIPFKSRGARWKNGCVLFAGHSFKVWDSYGLDNYHFRSGSFSEDSRGRWYFNVCVKEEIKNSLGQALVGVDLGLKDIATTSSGDKLVAGRFYQTLSGSLGKAQRARNKKRIKAIHAKIKNRRKDSLHKFSAKLISQNSAVFVGDVSSSSLVKTSMAKSVLDSGWFMLKKQLEYKAIARSVIFEVVNERYSTQACSCCGAISDNSPKGRSGLRIREWGCTECGAVHDRDINAARNILAAGHRRLAVGIPVIKCGEGVKWAKQAISYDRCPSHESEQQRWQEAFDTLPDDYETGDY